MVLREVSHKRVQLCASAMYRNFTECDQRPIKKSTLSTKANVAPGQVFSDQERGHHVHRAPYHQLMPAEVVNKCWTVPAGSIASVVTGTCMLAVRHLDNIKFEQQLNTSPRA